MEHVRHHYPCCKTPTLHSLRDGFSAGISAFPSYVVHLRLQGTPCSTLIHRSKLCRCGISLPSPLDSKRCFSVTGTAAHRPVARPCALGRSPQAARGMLKTNPAG
eukprot:4882847-Amphidinium_carterae.1